MKRLVLTILSVILSATLVSACLVKAIEADQEHMDRIRIVCTIFPQYDWIRQIIGEENMNNFDLILLIDARVDLHSFNPSVHDMAIIKTCDVFIYVGGDSDEWVNDVLAGANPDMVTVNLFEILGDSIIYEGHEHDGDECVDDDECEDDHDHSGDHDSGEHHADEHVWLSLRNAILLCGALTDVLSEIDPDNAQAYRDNLDAYIAALSDLDTEYRMAVDAASFDTLVFADRFPFRYLVDDYGLGHYAAFSGCSAETEASFVTIVSLANRLDQLGLDAVMVTESADQSIARTVVSSTSNQNHRILTLNSMQSVTASDIRDGTTYISIMESNLAVLKDALGA